MLRIVDNAANGSVNVGESKSGQQEQSAEGCDANEFHEFSKTGLKPVLKNSFFAALKGCATQNQGCGFAERALGWTAESVPMVELFQGEFRRGAAGTGKCCECRCSEQNLERKKESLIPE